MTAVAGDARGTGATGATGVTFSARTRLLALLGDPVEHSLSPVIQNAAFRVAEVDGAYVALRCDDETLPDLIRGIAAAGGGGNVTLPHKERAAAVVRPNGAVRRTGACNTFWGEDGEAVGDNTDVEGFRRAVRILLEEPPTGARVLLLGAGGAARAALVALKDDGVDEVVLLNRSTERARAVARRIGGEQARVADGKRSVVGEGFDLVVNATRLGLAPDDPLPLDLETLDRAGAVFDMVYGPEGTAFVRAAEAYGVRACDGGEMLVQQGAVAFERWWDEEAPLEAMRAALESAR